MSNSIEEQIVSILITHKNSAKSWADSNIDIQYFDPNFEHILSGVKYSAVKDSILTRLSYKEFLLEYKKLNNSQIAAQLSLFDKCFQDPVKVDNLPILLDRVKMNHIRRKSGDYIRDYAKNREKLGDIGANRLLADSLLQLENAVSENKANFVEIHKQKSKFLQDLQERRTNPSVRLKCGINEIDYTMTKGFKEGHLTLFCADVGSYKTTMMVNVATNIFKLYGANVLYIPLEMPADEIMTKIVARETRIDMHRIENAEQLTEDEIQALANEIDKWENLASRFSILDMAERTKVSTIRKEIEKRISYFKPRVVFIDYADNLIPDISRGNRNDLELNDMLEDMRKMGKALGFSVVSAAQLARDALKRINEAKDGKTNPLSSTDIRGGQVYTANSDNVYAQLKKPDNPKELIFSCIKSRHGRTTFKKDSSRAVLAVQPEFGLIESAPDDLTSVFSQHGITQEQAYGKALEMHIEEGSPF